MSEFLENIWSQFAIETEEHLEIIEQSLVAAERQGIGADDVARLFRSFHSIKGLSKAMDLLALERLSHRAEDLLGLVREGAVTLDSQAASLLLEAVDEIKALREMAVAERRDSGGPPSSVEARLHEAFLAAAGGDAANEDGIGRSGSAESAGSLHEDKDMLRFFMELVRENMPALTLPMDHGHAEGHRSPGCADCDRMVEALRAIGQAAEAMGYMNIAAVAEAICGKIPVEEPASPEVHAAIVLQLQELLDMVRYMEEATGTDVGSSTLAGCLTESMRANFERLLQAVAQDVAMLDAVAESASMDDEAVVNALLRHLAATSSYFSFLLPKSHCTLLLLLEDVFARSARGDLPVFDELVGLTRECLAFVREISRSMLDEGAASETPAQQSQLEALAQSIRDYVLAYESGQGGDNPVEAFRDFIKGLNISSELVEILSPENVRDLMDAVRDNEHIYEVLAHLESSEEVAGGFLSWVGKRGRVITNRSVFIDGQSWYEMLLVSKAPRVEVEAELRAIDPEKRLIELKASDKGVALEGQSEAGNASPSPKTPRSSSGAGAPGSNVIRVAGETLDKFMAQIGELVLVRAQLEHTVHDSAVRDALLSLKGFASQHDAMAEGGLSVQGLSHVYEIMERQWRRLAEANVLLQSALLRLQEDAMGLRVVPVETVFKRLPRVVRDLAQAQGKRIRLDMAGQEVRIDKAMVEVLSDPLMHMVRNSADHGIESPEERRLAGKADEAQILIKAMQQGSRVVVQVSDDGRGIDPERVRCKAVERGLAKAEESLHLSKEDIYQFLFMPGFSTAETVTETSGRGVGMDVVRTNVMRLGGAITVHSDVGKGSTFTLEMPLSAAVQEVMMVNVMGQTLALPSRYVTEVVEIETGAVQSVKGQQAMFLRGMFLPLVPMGEVLGFRDHNRFVAKSYTAVLVSNGQQLVGMEVDRVIGRRELFVKDIHPQLAALPGVGGASILGDGKVVLILDGEALLRLAESHRHGRHALKEAA